eukprot:1211154-Pleurochrysis_carterae.AAC.4
MVIINEDRRELVVANVGDSAAICYSPGESKHEQLSADHRLENNAEERARVRAAGSKLGQALDANGRPSGPVRVWPGGVCMARSIGDADAGAAGCMRTGGARCCVGGVAQQSACRHVSAEGVRSMRGTRSPQPDYRHVSDMSCTRVCTAHACVGESTIADVCDFENHPLTFLRVAGAAVEPTPFVITRKIPAQGIVPCTSLWCGSYVAAQQI